MGVVRRASSRKAREGLEFFDGVDHGALNARHAGYVTGLARDGVVEVDVVIKATDAYKGGGWCRHSRADSKGGNLKELRGKGARGRFYATNWNNDTTSHVTGCTVVGRVKSKQIRKVFIKLWYSTSRQWFSCTQALLPHNFPPYGVY